MIPPICENRRIAVIGSGLAGMICAVDLAHRGCKVTVFEKNQEPGGRLGRQATEGFQWDTNSSVLTQPEVLRKLWSRIGRKLEDYLQLTPLPLACRYLWADGTRIDDDAAFRQRPDVAQFIEFGKGAHEIAETFGCSPEDWLMRVALNPALLRNLPKLMPRRTMHAVAQNIFSDPHLVQLFDHYATRIGSSPFAAPAVLAYLAYREASGGVWHVQGGMHQIMQALFKVAGELGVEIRTGCEVTGVFDSNIAIAGKWHSFDATICNQDALMAYQSLLPRRRCGEFRDAYLNRYRTSFSSFMLHLGVDQQYPQLAHRNVLFSSDHNREFRQLINERVLAEEPTIELTISSRTEPGLAPEGCENWSIRVDTPPMRTSIQWGEIGEPTEELIIQRLEKGFGLADLRQHIVARVRHTPADLRKQLLNFGGSEHGFASHNLRNALIGPAMEPPGMAGFFFVGSTMRPAGGIPQLLQTAENAVAKTLGHLRHLPKPKLSAE